jgi:hypothetical protein
VGIEQQFIDGAAAAFSAAGDALTAVTYHTAPEGGSGTYTPATGTATVTPGAEIALNVLFARFKAHEIDEVRIRQNDCKILIEAAKLVDSSGDEVNPQLTDWIEEADGTRWEVKDDLSPLAVRALFVLQVRAAGRVGG